MFFKKEEKFGKLEKAYKIEKHKTRWDDEEKYKQCAELENKYNTKADRCKFLAYTFVVITGILIFALIASLILSTINPVCAKREVSEYKYNKEYVEQTILNGEKLENISITQIIIEKNQWLAKAKSSAELYGCFSSYYGLGVEELEPIVIRRTE